MKKRIFCLLLAMAMAFGLAACGGGGSKETGSPAPDETGTTEKPIKFAIMFGVGGLGDNAFNDEVGLLKTL